MGIAVVTGCSTGIGQAAALRLAQDGHHVVATMRNPAAADLPEGIEVRALDVNDDASVDVLFKDVFAEHGGVDILVNNAGLGGDARPVEEVPLENFREVMETNFFGALRCTKAVLPSMRERGAGCIVQVTSQAGRVVTPTMAPYAASKYALEAASEALAVEVAPFGIRVAIVEPGAIMTPIWGKVDRTPPTGPYAPKRNRLVQFVMAELAHASTADEVADCIAEAISTDRPKLRWLTGQGAERNVAVRRSLTDEEYIERWNMDDDAEFVRLMTTDPG